MTVITYGTAVVPLKLLANLWGSIAIVVIVVIVGIILFTLFRLSLI